MTGILLLFTVSLLSCGGQLCQKQAAHCRARGPWPVLRWMSLALILLGLGLLLWLRVLQLLPLSVAYPMLSINFILVTLSASWFFNEAVDRRHWLGVVFIMLGVLLMGINA